MPYLATVIEALIASPGDVKEERKIARDVILKWNQINGKKEGLIILPRMWEIDATPEMGGDSQEIINKQLVKDSDLIIAIFWTRLGTPTARADSGTVEEINQHISTGKPTMVYFSRKPINYDMSFDQREALRTFEGEIRSKGLLGEFTNDAEFKERVRDDLERTAHRILEAISERSSTPSISTVSSTSLSDKALMLLSVTTKSNNLQFYKVRGVLGERVWSGDTTFTQGDNPKDLIAWKGAIEELLFNDFCRDLNGKGQFFELTEKGINFLRDRFEESSETQVIATIRKTYDGQGAPPEEHLKYIARMPRSLVEGEGIEWNYDFILNDNLFRALVLGKIVESDEDDKWPYRKTWGWETLEFYEGDPKSLGRDYKQMGNGCLIWEQKA